MADTLDVIIAGAIGRGEFQNYAAADKLMDTYYLTFAVIISLRWSNTLAKRASVVLYLLSTQTHRRGAVRTDRGPRPAFDLLQPVRKLRGFLPGYAAVLPEIQHLRPTPD